MTKLDMSNFCLAQDFWRVNILSLFKDLLITI